MSKLARRALVASALGLFACAQLIGLDELKDRVTVTDGGGLDSLAPSDAGSTDGPTDADAGGFCDLNAECIDRSPNRASAVCVDHRCVAIDRELCISDVLPNKEVLRSNDVLLIATFLPFKDVNNPLELPAALAYELALTELDRASGIPTVGQMPRRDVALLVCNADRAEDSLKHVVNQLHVPAVIAYFQPPELGKLFPLTKQARVFMLNPAVTPEGIKYDNAEQWIWNLLGTSEDVALAYRPFVKQMTEAVEIEKSKSNIRIALVTTKNESELGMANVARQGRYIPTGPDAGGWDSRYALELASGDELFFEAMEAKDQGGTPDYVGLAARLDDFRPDLIVAITGEEIVTLAPAVDAKIQSRIALEQGDAGTGKDPTTLPIWILGPRNARFPGLVDHLLNPDAGVPGETPEKRRERYLGIQYASTESSEKQGWLDRMAIQHPNTSTDYSSAENYYDAIYWIAYGLYAGRLDGATTDAEAIKLGVRQMISGNAIYPGDTPRVADAFDDMKRNETTSLVGALGAPDIAPQFGTWRSVGAVYCYGDPKSGRPYNPTYDTLRYAPGAQDAPGTMVPSINSKCTSYPRPK